MPRSRIGLLFSALLLVFVTAVPGVAFAEPAPSGSTAQHDMLGGVLHGEGIVQTKKGPVRVAMQKGTATAVTDSSLTVRSSDGFTRTWTLADDVKVFDQRKSVQPEAVQAGTGVVLGGPVKANGGASGPSPSASTTYVAQVVFVQTAPSTGPSSTPS